MASSVLLQTNNGTDNQHWLFESSNGFYIITNKATGEVLDLTGAQTAEGTNVGTYAPNGTDAQLFQVTLVENELACHHIISPKLATDKFLTEAGNGVTDNKIDIRNNLNNHLQRFWLRKESDGYYLIIHSFTGKVFSV